MKIIPLKKITNDLTQKPNKFFHIKSILTFKHICIQHDIIYFKNRNEYSDTKLQPFRVFLYAKVNNFIINVY